MFLLTTGKEAMLQFVIARCLISRVYMHRPALSYFRCTIRRSARSSYVGKTTRLVSHLAEATIETASV